MIALIEKAIVVGASSGIGEAIALRLAAQGAHVALVARRQAELERVAGAIRAAGKGSCSIHVHDVARGEEAAPLFDAIRKEMGGCDGLIYAAGVMHKVEESEWSFEKDRQMVEVNLLGAMAWMNPAAAHFEAQRRGTILGISSIAGVRGRRGNPGYCTSKAALTTYLEALRNRASRYGVNVVTVKPGFVDTSMTKGMKGLFWLVSADEAARMALSVAETGDSAESFVPARWATVAAVVKTLPSAVFRRMNI